MLYPRETPTREVKPLDGVWRFKCDFDNAGLDQKWPERPLDQTIPMPVPASYNDLTQEIAIRDHVGMVWYEREILIPASWCGRDVVVRIGAATHAALVFVDGVVAGNHEGGFLPFDIDLTPHVSPGSCHRLTIMVDNRLSKTSLPPGVVERTQSCKYSPEKTRQTIHFDFFNYAGLNRSVALQSLPTMRIEDIAISTALDGVTGVVSYRVTCRGEGNTVTVVVKDADGRSVGGASGPSGTVAIPSAMLWDIGHGYLYRMEVSLRNAAGEVLDTYTERFGVRTIRVEGTKLLLNGRPVYLTGFGKHEDSFLHGRGFDPVTMVKDFNLLTWTGANSFRTSHYPYDEQWMEMADEAGILVIDECNAVGMLEFGKKSGGVYSDPQVTARRLATHLAAMRDLIARDKNHPCVAIWSVANEAATWEKQSRPYFEAVIAETRRLDPSRPVTIANFAQPGQCCVSDLLDIIGVNRYPAWYTDPGELDVIEQFMFDELTDWYETYRKPIIITEHGTDTIAGIHADPPTLFSEEYQCSFLENCHRAFDRLDFVVGEQVWNFADFQTKQGIKRVDGNRKGVFSRQRQPKMAAHLLRKRWRALAGGKSPKA